MAATKTAAKPEAQAQEPLYPAIEGFVEKATAEEIATLFTALKSGLAEMKGPKAEQAKKIGKAVERTEELLSHLLQVREKLESERKGGAKGRR